MSRGSESSTIERAFQLARTGACHSVKDIREELLRDGYSNVLSHISGMRIKKQRNAVLAARGVSKPIVDEDDDLDA